MWHAYHNRVGPTSPFRMWAWRNFYLRREEQSLADGQRRIQPGGKLGLYTSIATCRLNIRRQKRQRGLGQQGSPVPRCSHRQQGRVHVPRKHIKLNGRVATLSGALNEIPTSKFGVNGECQSRHGVTLKRWKGNLWRARSLWIFKGARNRSTFYKAAAGQDSGLQPHVCGALKMWALRPDGAGGHRMHPRS